MVNEPTTAPRKLVGWLPMALGVLAIVLGTIWTLQGLNVLTDAKMSNVRLWAVVGPVVAVIGLVLIIVGVRQRAKSKR
jgi:hypothetical protein